MSVFAVLIAAGILVWWSRNLWLVDALLLRSTIAAGVLAALAAGGWQLFQAQQFSLRTRLVVVTLIVTTLFVVLLGLEFGLVAWLTS